MKGTKQNKARQKCGKELEKLRKRQQNGFFNYYYYFATTHEQQDLWRQYYGAGKY